MRTVQEIYEDLVANCMAKGLGTYFGGGSALGMILQTFAIEIAELEAEAFKSEENSYVSTAKGSALDKHARDFNLTRVRANNASSDYDERNVRIFTKSGGAFNSIPGGMITLERTVVLSGLNGERPYIISKVDPSANLATDNEVYVSVVSLEKGEQGNIPEFFLRELSSGSEYLAVSNNYSIGNGRRDESDESLVSRISNQIASLESCNRKSLNNKLALLDSIGFWKIRTNGGGFVEVVVQPKRGVTLSNKRINAIKASIQEHVSAGAQVIVKTPVVKTLEFSAILTMTTVLNAVEKDSLERRILGALVTKMNTLRIGDSLSLNEVMSMIQSMDPRIKKIALSDTFTSISNGDSVYSEFFSNSSAVVPVMEDEVLILDYENSRISIL